MKSAEAKTPIETLEDFIYALRQRNLPYGRKVSALFARLDGADLFAETTNSRRAAGQMLIRLGAEAGSAHKFYNIPAMTTKQWIEGGEESPYNEQLIVTSLVADLAWRLGRTAPLFKNKLPEPPRPADDVPQFICRRKPG